MRFGVLNFPIGPFEPLAERFRRFESLGFDDGWVADDLLLRGYADFEPWTLLGALAQQTRRLRLGTLITTVRLRHPAFLAGQVLSLDQVSGGRAAVAIGSGEPYQNETIGNPQWSPREVLERLDEQAMILRTLLGGEPLEHRGPHYPTRVQEPPQPISRPPLVVAAHGSRGIRAAALYANAWNCLGGQPYGGGPSPAKVEGGRSLLEAVAETRRLMALVDEACTEVGRDPRSLGRTILAYRPRPDPFSSADAFDEYVGSFAEVGIESITFYWPPIDDQLEGRSPDAETEGQFDRIVVDRLG